MVTIELTTKCNFRCKHCFIEEYTESGPTTNEIFQWLEELREFGVYEIQLTGGEIFLRKDIMKIVKYARDLMFKVVLLTNVSLLTDDLIEELDKLYVETISATLFSLDNDVNDRITLSKNSASRVKNNLQKLSKSHIRMEVKTVILSDNSEEYKDIQKFCENNDIHFLATEGVFPSFSGDSSPRELSMSYSQLCRNIGCLDMIRFGKNFSNEKSADDPICCELHYSLFIGANGNIYPCNLWFKPLGNIRLDKVSTIWSASFLTKIRETKWKDLKKCSTCSKSKYCIRCTGIVEAMKGDYLLEDPYACRTANARQLMYTN